MKNNVILPIDQLEVLWPQALKGIQLGAVLHPASVGTDLRHSAEIIYGVSGELFNLTSLLGPQHGYLGHTQDNMIEWEGYKDPVYNVPVFSLYGEHREPTEEMLSHVDCLLIDLQDVGARYYTFIWTLYLCMKAAEKFNKTVVVCDRPNPITCVHQEGPVLDPEYASFVGLHPIPVRHAKTIGQLAELFKKESFPDVELHILPIENYKSDMWYDQTGLPWVLPSPNMPMLETAVVYPGMCLFEATNVSEGRGTTRPFELFGAPFINARDLCGYLNSDTDGSVFFREAHFQPTFQKWAGEICHGAQIHVQDRDAYKAFETGIQILRYLFHTYPQDFKWKEPPYEYEYEKMPIDILLGSGTYRKEFIEI